MLERLRSGRLKWLALPVILIGVALVAVRRFVGGDDDAPEEF